VERSGTSQKKAENQQQRGETNQIITYKGVIYKNYSQQFIDGKR